MAKLVLFLADGSTLDILLSRERTTIGRRPDNDICLPYPAVSGEHAAVVTILSDSFLEDRGSTNGTLVNGKPVTKHFLRDRDEIDVGRQRLVYLVDETVALGPPADAPGREEAALLGERGEPAQGAAAGPSPPAHNAEGDARERVEPAPAARHGREPASDSMSDIDRFVAAEVGAAIGEADAAGSAEKAEGPTLAPAAPKPVAVIRVLSGPSAGREVALDKAETLIGRAGVQVAAVRNSNGKLKLVLVEGAAAPTVNGEPVGGEGVELRAGDRFEIAGTEIEVAAHGDS